MVYLDFYASLLLALVFARLYFQIGEYEYGSGYICCLLSVALSLFAIFTLSGGVRTVIAIHVLLFFGLWLYNYFSDKNRV
jgi:hypothetical protein